ncbi:Glycosyl transferase group 1 [Devosia sp. LC5]|uniref:glycosyltransferase n=1 Tax=Devosia sp. LC5 TaxID=1502724 RepID=UPI0004E31AAC|nr:glycosyltransferase [Devosia sp. LC5]KFC64555.1 Glycosyl transferase group 1 [Devosia sp. LC5]
MKILHVYKTYLPEDFTGVPRVIHALAEGAARAGAESSVFALTRGGRSKSLHVGQHQVHLAPQNLAVASTGFSLSAFAQFKSLAATADIIHYHYPWPMGDLLHFYARPSCPVVVTYHSDIVRQKTLLHLYAPLRDRFLAGMDRVIATSSAYAETSLTLKKFSSKVCVIPIGMDDSPAPDPAKRTYWRDRVGTGFFLFVGALRYYKGIDFLMQAAKRNGLPVIVAGSGDPAPWQGPGIEKVTFVGEIDDADKLALLDLCHAFVFPSHLRSEAFGISLVEAARAGKPMICAEIGTGTTFINIDGLTGLVVPPGDAAALSAAMTLLANTPGMARAMGQAARYRYETLFRAQFMVDAHVDLYSQLLGGHKPSGIADPHS